MANNNIGHFHVTEYMRDGKVLFESCHRYRHLADREYQNVRRIKIGALVTFEVVTTSIETCSREETY